MFDILKEVLKIRKVCTRWISDLLASEQKGVRIEKTTQLLAKYNYADSTKLREIANGDELWL